jgi:hypothetical protein
MNGEKVKEIKKALECCSEGKCEKCLIGKKDIRKCIDILFKDTLTLINELETENERLMKLQARGGCRVAELCIENQQLKDRITELENKDYKK